MVLIGPALLEENALEHGVIVELDVVGELPLLAGIVEAVALHDADVPPSCDD